MPKAKGKAIIVSQFTALTPIEIKDSRLTQEELKESMGAARPSLSDLDKIIVPSGGGTSWEVLDKTGELVNVRGFEAVIVAAQDIRRFYASKYDGGNEPPDCISLDLKHGMVGENCPPDVTGECDTCPKAAWGTATNDKGQPTKGKACSERKQMILFRPHTMIPEFISIPPSSLKEVQSYICRLPPTGEAYYSVVTKFSLRKEKNDNGIPYSQVQCEFVRALNDGELSASKMIGAQFRQAVAAVTNTDTE